MKKRIAIIGGGPAALFLFKHFVEANRSDLSIDIFERSGELGSGMPYSEEGANTEHITNVSGNEIPELNKPLVDWIKTLPDPELTKYGIEREKFHEYQVLPRLLFGRYLHDQFESFIEEADNQGVTTTIHLHSRVTDIIDVPEKGEVIITVNDQDTYNFHRAVICTGHKWPVKYEGKIDQYFDSPYPPQKIKLQLDHEVAITGSSLTAIDAIRTLARMNGKFIKKEKHQLEFILNKESANLKIVMHSLQGLLPAIRFHLEDTHLSADSLLSEEEIAAHRKQNNGFLSLDFIFEKDFREPLREKDPKFYEQIKDMMMEEFVEKMMSYREEMDPFVLFKKEYREAAQSIKNEESVHWKEKLATLSFAMNYPAKHFSAEDMLRLKKVLMPLISVVIAFVPQSSCEEMIALHESGCLQLVDVNEESHVEPHPEGGIIYHLSNGNGHSKSKRYKTYIDGKGQPQLMIDDFPFKSLVKNGTVSEARLAFRSPACAVELMEQGDKQVEEQDSGIYYLKVPGIGIADNFRVYQKDGKLNDRIYVMAVPYIGGFNPDYSGLDFCEEASSIVIKDLLESMDQ